MPDIRLNLISTCTLDDKDYSNASQNCKCKITKDSSILAKANKCCHNELYILEVSIFNDSVNAIENPDISKFWHKIRSQANTTPS